MRTIPKKIRNVGASYGLEYPYIHRELHVVWHRHTGKIAHIEHTGVPFRDESTCAKKCRELNGLTDEHDPYINVLHDMEA